ncbi:MAG: hypothetical protein IJC13_05680 [Clostridia bacterium]|nr:hypothetical protein [Clostridia bacterium]
MKINKKTLYIAIAFVCILVVSIFVTIKNKDSTSFAPADNQSSISSSTDGFSNTEATTDLPFEYEETEEASGKSVAEEKVTEFHTIMPTTIKKEASIDNKPFETSKGTTNTKVPTTTKYTVPTKPSSTKPSKVQSATEPSTETTTKKILYYYTDGSTGYTPKPGAEYYSNGCWNIVSWGNSVSDEEIKEAHKKCKYCGREDCIRFWISEQKCPDCGVLVPVDICHHCS